MRIACSACGPRPRRGGAFGSRVRREDRGRGENATREQCRLSGPEWPCMSTAVVACAWLFEPRAVSCVPTGVVVRAERCGGECLGGAPARCRAWCAVPASRGHAHSGARRLCEFCACAASKAQTTGRRSGRRKGWRAARLSLGSWHGGGTQVAGDARSHVLSREQCRVCRPEWSCVPTAAVARAGKALGRGGRSCRGPGEARGGVVFVGRGCRVRIACPA